MLGFRGACRYTDERYRKGSALECRALKKAREELGLENILAMVPFCRTADEADRVLAAMKEEGLERGQHGLQVWVMCEVPERDPSRGLRRPLRRLLHRQRRSDAAEPQRRSRRRASGDAVLAEERGRRARHPRRHPPRPRRGQARGHLRPGVVGPRRLRRAARAGRHRLELAEPRQRARRARPRRCVRGAAPARRRRRAGAGRGRRRRRRRRRAGRRSPRRRATPCAATLGVSPSPRSPGIA